MERKVVEINKNIKAIHTDTGNVYTVDLNTAQPGWQNIIANDGKVSWEKAAQNVRGYRIVPYGENNDLPVVIRNIMDDNNLAPGILERHIGLLYGNGPQLYSVKFENGEVWRDFVYDEEIWAWLKTWDYRRYIEMALTEYKYLKGFFTRRYRNRGPRMGFEPKIAKLEVIPGTDARLEWPENDSRRLEDVKRILVGDFEDNCFKGGITPFPVYNALLPFKYALSMSYHNSYSFARNFYSVPSYYGALKWIKRSSDIPDILKYLTENGISVAFHIHTPADYWEQKREKLERQFKTENESKIDKRLELIKDATFENISRVLSGKKNAGKFIETVDFYDDEGNLCVWKIEPIDQKIDDFVKSQLAIAEKADGATTSGMGLNSSLSNIVVNGQLSSGSQMLYALKLYMASDTTIAEEVIFEALNQAIAANFPAKALRIGFYHQVVLKEENVNPEQRVATNA